MKSFHKGNASLVISTSTALRGGITKRNDGEVAVVTQ
jgi:hypothetical protein